MQSYRGIKLEGPAKCWPCYESSLFKSIHKIVDHLTLAPSTVLKRQANARINQLRRIVMDAASTKSKLQERSWRKDQFLISTNPAHFPIPTLIEIFDRKDFYWAKPLPAQDMREMLQNSLSFGLYEQLDHQHPGNSAPEATLIGIAR